MSSNKKGKNVGGYSLIYKGAEDLAHYDAYNIWYFKVLSKFIPLVSNSFTLKYGSSFTEV